MTSQQVSTEPAPEELEKALTTSGFTDIVRHMKDSLLLYKSLSDETRLRIMALLLAEGELCVCDIIAALQLPQSTISRQLAILKKAGWVNDRRCGLWVHYSIRADQGYQKELILLLKKQLTGTKASAADRKVFADFGRDNNCA